MSSDPDAEQLEDLTRIARSGNTEVLLAKIQSEGLAVSTARLRDDPTQTLLFQAIEGKNEVKALAMIQKLAELGCELFHLDQNGQSLMPYAA